MNGHAANNGAIATQEPLRWPSRVVTAEALQRSLNGHRELVLPPRAIITPLAAEHLRQHGVRIATELPSSKPAAEAKTLWGVAQDHSSATVVSAVQALARDGVALQALPAPGKTQPEAGWARAVAECVAAGQCCGGVVFCSDPGLVCCIANKIAGLRAVAVLTVVQAVRATQSLAANLLAVEMPGRTFFEVRQILRTLCTTPAACPDGVACTLQELDGHAHR